MEQRAVVKFLVAEGEKASKVLERLKGVYGEACMSKTQLYEWYQRFKDGRDSIADDKHSGRPVSATDGAVVDLVEKLVLEDRRITIEDLASATAVSVWHRT